MIRAVVWKELREQGLIAVMLVVLGGALLVAAAALADPPSPSAPATDVVASLGAGRLLTLMLVVTAGMVCGGALFAAEKEAGTMAFLDALPAARWPLWRAKLIAGAVLALAQVAVLMGVAAALDLADAPFLRRLLVYAVLAFAWGALGSTLARTTLGAVGVAIPAASLAMFVFLLPIYVFFSRPGTNVPRPVGWALFEALMVVTPLAVSAWRFTAPDRARAADAGAFAPAAGADAPAHRNGRPGLGLRALAWLTLRQLRLVGAVLSAFALAFGLALLLPELRPVFVWPVLALAAGVLTGVTAFGDEQSHRTALFWGEHRLPIGRAWGVKVALHLGLLAWLLVLLALPSVVRSQVETADRFNGGRTALAAVFHSRLFDELGAHGWKYLLVPAAYGFAFGHLCGVLFRKLVVACGVAVMIGGVGAALWVPSLLAGGAKHWQVWLPAAAALLTGRFLIRGWAAERVTDCGPLLRLVGGGAAVALAFAVGVGYRVLQVPDVPGGADDGAFVVGLPSYDENASGREFRAAAERFARVATAVAQGPGRTADLRQRPRIDERLKAAVQSGWNEDAELGAWLDRVCSDPPVAPDDVPWPALAETAAGREVGVYEPPQLVSTTATTAAGLDNARQMAVTLLARGLQLQAAGDPAAFVAAFRTAVALARTLRNGAGLLGLVAGLDLERVALYAADRWMERLPGRADLLLAVARAAAAADDPAPFDPRPHVLSDRYVIRGQMLAPNQWLLANLASPREQPERAAAEVDLVTFAWSVPWERERTRRLVGLAPDAPPGSNLFALVNGRPGASLLARNRSAADAADIETQLRVARRVSILKAAVLAYRAERGGPPAALAELVDRGYIARQPEDPYAAGRPFGYRVSVGETLRGPARAAGDGRAPEEMHLVPVDPGRVVLWSVGVDGIDQGGLVPPGGPRAEDLVFLVPVPAPPAP